MYRHFDSFIVNELQQTQRVKAIKNGRGCDGDYRHQKGGADQKTIKGC